MTRRPGRPADPEPDDEDTEEVWIGLGRPADTGEDDDPDDSLWID